MVHVSPFDTISLHFRRPDIEDEKHGNNIPSGFKTRPKLYQRACNGFVNKALFSGIALDFQNLNFASYLDRYCQRALWDLFWQSGQDAPRFW